MAVLPYKTFFFQDSIPSTTVDTTGKLSPLSDTSVEVIQFTNEELINIPDTEEHKEGELDSLSRVQAPGLAVRPSVPPGSSGFDTAAVPYYLYPVQKILKENPLDPFQRKFFVSRDTSEAVFIEETQSTIHPAQISHQKMDFLPASTNELMPDWLFVLILVSLILIAWLKLFYNKFFDQTMQSLMNFQLSVKMLRDQNIFSRRVALALNLNFVLICGAFIYLLFGYFNIKPFPYSDLVSFFTYSGIVVTLLLLRYIISHLIGHIFQKQVEFQGYLHQILLIYKNLGIYLIPVAIGIAYIHEDIRIYFIYLGCLMLVASLILRIIKGFKILMHKYILILYLILYLCILEILPLLIFYKFFALSVMTG